MKFVMVRFVDLLSYGWHHRCCWWRSRIRWCDVYRWCIWKCLNTCKFPLPRILGCQSEFLLVHLLSFTRVTSLPLWFLRLCPLLMFSSLYHCILMCPGWIFVTFFSPLPFALFVTLECPQSMCNTEPCECVYKPHSHDSCPSDRRLTILVSYHPGVNVYLWG